MSDRPKTPPTAGGIPRQSGQWFTYPPHNEQLLAEIKTLLVEIRDLLRERGDEK